MINVKRFPNNIYEPTTIEVDGRNYSLYKASFTGLVDLQQYLRRRPSFNNKVFFHKSSITNGKAFAGDTYRNFLKVLNKPVDKEYADFLKVHGELEASGYSELSGFQSKRSTAGGIVDVPSFVSGSPLCYRTETEVYEPKFVKLNVLLCYSCGNSHEQIKNRAYITIALINALEKAGYHVDVNAFELSKEWDEYAYIKINLKNCNDVINKRDLIRSLCYVEFSRRILFRVLETMPLTRSSWEDSYGQIVEREEVLEALNLSGNDIYIDEPSALGICGGNIEFDFRSTVDKLGLNDIIDVERSVRNLKQSAKVLTR